MSDLLLPNFRAIPPASVLAEASFLRPANTTAYTAGDLVANSTTAGSVVPMALAVARIAGGSGQILRARLRKSGTGIVNARFRLHLFTAAPTVANGDNGALSMTGAAGYLGAVDVVVDRAFTDGAVGVGAPAAGPVIVFATAADSANVHVLVEALADYTPVSGETIAVALDVVRD